MYPDPTEFSQTQLLLRRYACPACATLLAHEFCLAEDEPWHDFRIEARRRRVSGYLVGVDIGGTFTDCAIIAPDGTNRMGKVRPDRGSAAELLRGDRRGRAGFGLSLGELLAQAERVVHGTTTGTNALITREERRSGSSPRTATATRSPS